MIVSTTIGRTTTSGSTTVANSKNDDAVEGSWSPRRPRTAAEQRAESTPPAKDVETLASDIDKTREELAETLDAIVDKVSPKKVAKRTGQKVSDSVKETAAKAGDSLKVGAAAVAETAKGAAESVKESAIAAKEGAAAQVAEVTGKSGSAQEPVAAAPFAPLAEDAEALPVTSAGALADADPGVYVAPPGAEVPPYTMPSPVASSKLPLYGGAGAALIAIVLVLRRRRRR